MKYSTTTEDQLTILQQGLDILGHVNRELLPSTLYLFGLLNSDSPVLAEVDDAVWEDSYAGETRAENISIKTACIAIRLSDDVLRALLGGGLRCDNSDFAYVLNGETHSSSFSYAQRKPTISIAQFSKMALADESYWLEDFIKGEGLAQDDKSPSVVTRTKSVGGDHGGTQNPLHQPHQSSLNVHSIAEFVADPRR